MTSISPPTNRDHTPILQVNTLQKKYGKFVAVQDVSFAVYPQQVFCLVGPNGAGKTSIIDCIVGLKKPNSGDIHLFGESNPILRRRKDIRSRIGIQFQEDSLYNDIRVKEALHLYASMYQNPVHPDELMNIFELQRQYKTAYKHLSGGEKRRLLIAIALVGNPDLLILDEPSSNLDPHVRRQLWEVLNQYRQDGLTIVMTTHNMREAQQYSDRVCIVKSGHVIASGSVAQLLEKYQLNIKIEVEGEGVAEVVADCPGVTHVDVAAQDICIYGKNRGFEDEVIKRLKDLGIQQFAIKNADLEDVYLLATRRRYTRYTKDGTENPSTESEALLAEGQELLQNAIDVSDVNPLYEAQAKFERALKEEGNEALVLYYLALCEYYLLIDVFDIAHIKKGRCINRAIKYLKKATDLIDTFADAHALLGIFYHHKISLKPYLVMVLGPVLGPLSTKIIEKAKRLEGDNPRVVLVDAISNYFTPPMFGGDKAQALAKLERAVDLFSKEEVRNPSWGHQEAYIFLGRFRQETGDIAGAKEAFAKALEINPNDAWVKSQLQVLTE